MSIRVSLLHPTRGRPVLAFKAYNEWVDAAINPKEIEYIMVLDDDDPSLGSYNVQLAAADQNKVGRFVYSVGETRTCVAALHKASSFMSEESELIIGITDDVGSMKDWDKLLFDILKPYDNFNDPKFIGVQDGVHGFGAMLYLIINKAWYKRVGYVICPEYTGVHADDDMRETAKKLNSVIEAPQIMFEHRHPCVGKAQWDDTYARHNNPEGYAKNAEVYRARAARGFDIKKEGE